MTTNLSNSLDKLSQRINAWRTDKQEIFASLVSKRLVKNTQMYADNLDEVIRQSDYIKIDEIKRSL